MSRLSVFIWRCPCECYWVHYSGDYFETQLEVDKNYRKKNIQEGGLEDYTEKGDITLGMVNPVTVTSVQPVITFTNHPPPRPCDLFRRPLYKSILASLFAIKEVNENPDLLPNITLGFQMFDSCFSEATSLQAIFQLTSVSGNYAPNYKCGNRSIVPAVIGDISSSSIAMARVLGLWKIPQVSYLASVPSLSNKIEFPSFLRTMPSNTIQPQVLIELCKTFGWTWVGFLTSSVEYCVQLAAAFKREAAKEGICVAFSETVTSGSGQNKMSEILVNVQKSTAKVIILYCFPVEVESIFTGVYQQNLTGKMWISIKTWHTTPLSPYLFFRRFLNGTIGVVRSRIPPNFVKFLHFFHPYSYPRMFSIHQFWEKLFNCKWSMDHGNGSTISGGDHFTQTCTGSEKLVMEDVIVYNDPSSQSEYNSHNAVYAIVHALHHLLSCKPGTPCAAGRARASPATGYPRSDILSLMLWCEAKLQYLSLWTRQLLHYLKRVHFVNTAGKEVSFNTNGDINGYFNILNWCPKENTGQIEKVGFFDDNREEKLTINDTMIFWVGQVPCSVCSDNCSPGYWKVPQRGQPFCCFDCRKCSEGMISNQTNSPDCSSCPKDQWPNKQRTKCDPKIIEFLSYEEPLGQILASSCIVFSLTSMIVLCVFIKSRNTAVVKANNRNLSYVLLISLVFCFLCSLLFIGHPGRLACTTTIRQSLFGMTFSLCISCILAKTIIVVIAFKATRPGSGLRLWAGSRTAILVVTSTTSVHALIIMVWLVKFPPSLFRDYHEIPGRIILECDASSVLMFYCTIGYLTFLASLSFVVAFLARNLPDSFNEAKNITFSMLTFLSVWSSFIPAYLSTKGKYIVAVEIFAIFLSSLGLLFCIFGPKCYIILIKPSKMTRVHLIAKFS
ncbi:LOW QUALITY PROTEIN: extracellular calcium-sensing receptor-like [Hyla sarda]|uniref:LOW QUALITY PROTEIN: extracellular calcium-sensing receptor-like n=1 Tax=Hyla sarda TaxID=327740 RepID=UPI0024C2AAF9|nr:LOW QUALITY PROTEIN: extracellular calcium-sensing receptor-like [Hyla sarda]